MLFVLLTMDNLLIANRNYIGGFWKSSKMLIFLVEVNDLFNATFVV